MLENSYKYENEINMPNMRRLWNFMKTYMLVRSRILSLQSSNFILNSINN